MYFAWFIQDRGYVQYLFVLLTTKYHRTTLPRIPGEVDTEERGKHGYSKYRLNTSDKCFKRKQFIHSTVAELQVSMAVYFLYRKSANDDL